MKGFGGMREMNINHGRTRTGFANARSFSEIRKRKRSVSVLVFGLFNHGLHGLASLTLAILGMSLSAGAATGTSGEFRVDLAGMGPWEMRTAAASEAISYSTAWVTNALDGANAVVKVWSVKREKPKYIAIDLSGGTAATHYPIKYLDEIPGGTWSDEYKTSKLVLRHIPAGSFIMGGRATDYPGASNTNLHMVTLTKDFYMGVFEVTQRQWELVMGNRPSTFSNETCYATRPVERVTYVDIRGGMKGVTWPESKEVDDGSFMERLRKKSGLTGYDLPTEAQWEYACRAGTTTALNSGKNCSHISNSVEVAEVARYYHNGGELSWGEELLNNVAMSTTSIGTAKVGSYTSNQWGLYDMHGNVWELCLDAVTNICSSGSVNPVGDGNDLKLGYRAYRGGAYGNQAWEVRSANRWSIGDRPFGAWLEYNKTSRIGFRLCLQGGELPELNNGTVLVNEPGNGTANWTPTKAGTYYLTHETQTNGVNGAEVLGAWFTVGGPELSFTPDGDLTPGVNISINGAGEGWHIYYTIDGSAPTQSPASEYTSPITLNDSATIRAIAFSDGGMESREFSATYSLMSVVGAVAKPRYPWNGKVDIDCEVKGDANLGYLVSLAAIDLDGNTNLPVRTVVGRAAPSAPQSQENDFVFGGAAGIRALPPGTYRFTWDADADIAGDFDFANVAVSVSAEGSAIVAAKKVLPLEVAGYAGTETLTNVPVLVRLSTAISGFSYADFADVNGGDLIFTDESGSVVYPHEIDEWHTDGESLVWVKLPQMANGTRFKAAYGNAAMTGGAQDEHAVWSDYAGVWHMNEDSGTAFDSTAHGLDALPSCGTNGTSATMAQMVAYENGACGRARVNSLKLPGRGNDRQNFMLIPSYDGLGIGGRFVISGWFNGEYWNDGTSWSPRLISRKQDSIADSGWEICYRETFITVSDDSSTSVSYDIPALNSAWVNLSVVYDEASCVCYTNGVSCGNMALAVQSVDNATSLAFGNTATGSRWSFIGQYDEIRLRGGTLSADRIKADYDMIKNRNFLSYGSVENGKGAAE